MAEALISSRPDTGIVKAGIGSYVRGICPAYSMEPISNTGENASYSYTVVCHNMPIASSIVFFATPESIQNGVVDSRVGWLYSCYNDKTIHIDNNSGYTYDPQFHCNGDTWTCFWRSKWYIPVTYYMDAIYI